MKDSLQKYHRMRCSQSLFNVITNTCTESWFLEDKGDSLIPELTLTP